MLKIVPRLGYAPEDKLYPTGDAVPCAYYRIRKAKRHVKQYDWTNWETALLADCILSAPDTLEQVTQGVRLGMPVDYYVTSENDDQINWDQLKEYFLQGDL